MFRGKIGCLVFEKLFLIFGCWEIRVDVEEGRVCGCSGSGTSVDVKEGWYVDVVAVEHMWMSKRGRYVDVETMEHMWMLKRGRYVDVEAVGRL